ncbi:TPA: hypothetical protein JBG15_04350 [Legionella pneumophila]|nr:hypothetical protein [Legionella pneumophila]
MERLSSIGKLFRFIYKQIFLRFSNQIRNPYLIKVDKIYTDSETNELSIAFHIANKRVNQEMSVAEFVSTDMIYMIDPRVVFDLGQHYGSHSEKLVQINKPQTSIKTRCVTGLKRVFVDE